VWVLGVSVPDEEETELRGGAPSGLPEEASDRGKPDRRAAVHLARLLRSGDLMPVYSPPVEDRALRGVVWAREDALKDGKAAKPRLTAVLLGQDMRYEGRATWGPARLRWLAKGGCPPHKGRVLSQR
jgi:transposase